MKKPNKLYRKLGGHKTAAGHAFASARHPVRSLRHSFGWDRAASDAAEGFNVGFTKDAFWKVMRVLRSWEKNYRGPKLSGIFRMLTMNHNKPFVNTPKPKPD